jgi:hypothetical protein
VNLDTAFEHASQYNEDQRCAIVIPVYLSKRYKNGLLRMFCNRFRQFEFSEVVGATHELGTHGKKLNNIKVCFLPIAGDQDGNPSIPHLKIEFQHLVKERLTTVKKLLVPRMCGNRWEELKTLINLLCANALNLTEIEFLEA